MQLPFSDYDVWSFHKSDPENWTWRRTSPDGEVLLEGRAAFSTIEECLADARRHGYNGSFSVA
jgi:hypothetical protein